MSQTIDLVQIDEEMVNINSNEKAGKLFQPFKVAVKEVAVLTGYNDFKAPIDIIEKFIYQKRYDLYSEDIAILKAQGITFISEEENVRSLLAPNLVDDIEMITNELMDKSKKGNILGANQVNESVNTIQTILKKANENNSNQITTEDMKVLEDHFLAPIKQTYGTQGENGILEAYECSTGWKIDDRNEQMYETPIHLKDGVLTIGTCRPSLVNNNNHNIKPTIDYIGEGKENEVTMIMSQGDEEEEPVFILRGFVDGISYQLDNSSDDALNWNVVKVVVEAKARVRKVHTNPPLPDIIQLMGYMYMHGAVAGDLVQALVQRKVEEDDYEGDAVVSVEDIAIHKQDHLIKNGSPGHGKRNREFGGYDKSSPSNHTRSDKKQEKKDTIESSSKEQSILDRFISSSSSLLSSSSSSSSSSSPSLSLRQQQQQQQQQPMDQHFQQQREQKEHEERNASLQHQYQHEQIKIKTKQRKKRKQEIVADSIHIHRLNMDESLDATMYKSTVLPTLHAVLDRIHEIRTTQLLRLAWLTGSDEDRWNILIPKDAQGYLQEVSYTHRKR